MLCCLIALLAASPVGAWIVSRRSLAVGQDCCDRSMVIAAALLAALLGVVCAAISLSLFGIPETFRPICGVLKTPSGWLRL